MWGGMEVYFQTFLISPDRSSCQLHAPVALPPHTHWTESWVGPRAGTHTDFECLSYFIKRHLSPHRLCSLKHTLLVFTGKGTGQQREMRWAMGRDSNTLPPVSGAVLPKRQATQYDGLGFGIGNKKWRHNFSEDVTEELVPQRPWGHGGSGSRHLLHDYLAIPCRRSLVLLDTYRG